ncbi:MAG TPA: hypothetical protein VI521_02935 [Candidatus Babeliales bacterium]|nr:hypothetical protein [Candidatus Babeliales bacterium]
MKHIVIAGMLLSISTALKICSVIALCSVNIHSHEHEHDHHKMILAQKKQVQTSRQPVV